MWLILFQDLEYIFQDLEYIFQDLKHQAISEGKKIIPKYKKIKIAIMANYVERRCPTKLTKPTRTITQASLVGAFLMDIYLDLSDVAHARGVDILDIGDGATGIFDAKITTEEPRWENLSEALISMVRISNLTWQLVLFQVSGIADVQF